VPGVARFRVNAFNQNRGAGAVFRTIPSKVLTLEDLGCPRCSSDLRQPRGLVLVTGPTGSGKSTTLAAMVDYLNNTEYGHILTVEDPIEFVHESKKCLINQREVHRDTHGFNQRAALGPARRPGRHPGGRDARPGNHPPGADRRRNRPPGVRHPAHHLGGQDHRPDRRRVPADEKDMVRSMLSESLRR
jgi:twitching motility protein PilT